MTILVILFGCILLGVGLLLLVPTLVGILAPSIVVCLGVWVAWRLIRKFTKILKEKTS
jgi:hypothetical protein